MEYFENDPVKLNGDGTAVSVIDQTLLPGELRRIELRTADDISGAIKRLAVRGAPCIGVCAGYGVYVCAAALSGRTADEFMSRLRHDAAVISGARPTAVNLSWAVNRMMAAAEELYSSGSGPEGIISALRAEAETIHCEDIEVCRRISRYGLELIHDGDSVITHCNAGALATSRYGTGLGPLLLGAEEGLRFRAYVDETRPLLQGARLTAYELANAGVDVTLMCDNMAAHLMSGGEISACMTGCDRVAANGDTANKIGTLGLAVLARHFDVPFYVFCPTSTIDPSCGSGADIVIEQRSPEEIVSLYFNRQVAPAGVRCLNPAFDVTPASLITAIITENGILYPPFNFA